MTPSRDAPPISTPAQRAVQSPTSHLARRDFLSLAGRGALWATLGASIVALGRLIGFREPEAPKVFTLDSPEAYPAGRLTPVVEGRAFIGRDERGLFAIAATCTHLGCLVEIRDQRFECPCHGSRFEASGAVLQGPAGRPLARVLLTLEPGGKVVIHLRQTVDDNFRLAVGSA